MSLKERCRECGQEFPYVDVWTIFCPTCEGIALRSDRHRPINEANRCDCALGTEHDFSVVDGSELRCLHCRRTESEARRVRKTVSCRDCYTPVDLDGPQLGPVRCQSCALCARLFTFAVDTAREEFKR